MAEVHTIMGAKSKSLGHASWDAKIAALEDLFRTLPVQPPSKVDAIPYSFLIPGIGRQLMLMSPVSRRTQIPGKKAVKALAQKTGRIVELLDGLSQPVIEALNFRQSAIGKLKTDLRILHAAAKEADVAGVNFRDGAPQKSQARKIAIVVATHYFGLTGKKPTLSRNKDGAYGQFFDLLKAVYEILGVNASTESQANGLIKDWPSIAAESGITDYRIK